MTSLIKYNKHALRSVRVITAGDENLRNTLCATLQNMNIYNITHPLHCYSVVSITQLKEQIDITVNAPKFVVNTNSDTYLVLLEVSSILKTRYPLKTTCYYSSTHAYTPKLIFDRLIKPNFERFLSDGELKIINPTNPTTHIYYERECFLKDLAVIWFFVRNIKTHNEKRHTKFHEEFNKHKHNNLVCREYVVDGSKYTYFKHSRPFSITYHITDTNTKHSLYIITTRGSEIWHDWIVNMKPNLNLAKTSQHMTILLNLIEQQNIRDALQRTITPLLNTKTVHQTMLFNCLKILFMFQKEHNLLSNILTTTNKIDVLFTGHSLGAGCSLILSYILVKIVGYLSLKDYIHIRCYIIAAPKCLDENTHKFVNDLEDFVHYFTYRDPAVKSIEADKFTGQYHLFNDPAVNRSTATTATDLEEYYLKSSVIDLIPGTSSRTRFLLNDKLNDLYTTRRDEHSMLTAVPFMYCDSANTSPVYLPNRLCSVLVPLDKNDEIGATNYVFLKDELDMINKYYNGMIHECSKSSSSVVGGNAIISILGRNRKVTMVGRKKMITYKGKQITVGEARKLERKLAKEKTEREQQKNKANAVTAKTKTHPKKPREPKTHKSQTPSK